MLYTPKNFQLRQILDYSVESVKAWIASLGPRPRQWGAHHRGLEVIVTTLRGDENR